MKKSVNKTVKYFSQMRINKNSKKKQILVNKNINSNIKANKNKFKIQVITLYKIKRSHIRDRKKSNKN